jgi:hypothetical protein
LVILLIMPSHEEHCQDSLERYGKRFDKLHHWLDEPSTLLGKGHRIHRHDLVKTPKQAKELFGEFADQACLDHIRLDRLEERRLKRERSKKQNPKKKDSTKRKKFHKASMREEVTEYCGNELLKELIQKCNETRVVTDRNYRIKRDKALIALLFLTGGRISEVLMLKKKNFDFDNEEAKRNNAFLIKDMELLKQSIGIGKPKRETRTFPIWKDDPLVQYVYEWLPEIEHDLFSLSRHRAWQIVFEVGKRLDRPIHINPSWFREQREHYLIEKKGFSPYIVQAYFKFFHPPKILRRHKDWQNILAVTRKFEQETINTRTRIPKGKVQQSAKIMNLLYATNFLFKAKKEATLFREDILKLISELFTPCQNEPQFITKIACLYNLFDVPLKPLKNLVDEPENKGSIKLVKEWLINQGKCDQKMIETWENIVTLRNAEPIHANISSEKANLVLNALKFFETRYPVNDYSKLWDNILEKFISSLESWQNILQEL